MSERHRAARVKSARRQRLWHACLNGLIDLQACDEVHQILFGESFLIYETDEPVPAPERRRPPRPKADPRIMYLISNGEFGKVGITSNLDARFSQLQHANGHLLTVERFVASDCAVKLEKAMHVLLGSRHQRGEWFRITNAEWDELLPKAQELTLTM